MDNRAPANKSESGRSGLKMEKQKRGGGKYNRAGSSARNECEFSKSPSEKSMNGLKFSKKGDNKEKRRKRG